MRRLPGGEMKKGQWTPEEDKQLLDYIRKNGGHGSWRRLPKLAGLNRCHKSCRLRWTNYLRQDIKRGNFTADEDNLIITQHAAVGNKWSFIASKLPGRTDNEIKNHWNKHLRKKLLNMGIDPTTHRPRFDLNNLAANANAATTQDMTKLQADAAAMVQILQGLFQVFSTATANAATTQDMTKLQANKAAMFQILQGLFQVFSTATANAATTQDMTKLQADAAAMFQILQGLLQVFSTATANAATTQDMTKLQADAAAMFQILQGLFQVFSTVTANAATTHDMNKLQAPFNEPLPAAGDGLSPAEPIGHGGPKTAVARPPLVKEDGAAATPENILPEPTPASSPVDGDNSFASSADDGLISVSGSESHPFACNQQLQDEVFHLQAKAIINADVILGEIDDYNSVGSMNTSLQDADLTPPLTLWSFEPEQTCPAESAASVDQTQSRTRLDENCEDDRPPLTTRTPPLVEEDQDHMLSEPTLDGSTSFAFWADDGPNIAPWEGDLMKRLLEFDGNTYNSSPFWEEQKEEDKRMQRLLDQIP
ncbi:hypothetical protein ABZP36_010537 [Zizania latifolia]